MDQDDDFMNQFLQLQDIKRQDTVETVPDSAENSPLRQKAILSPSESLKLKFLNKSTKAILELPDALKKDRSKCTKVKSSENPHALTQAELYEFCVRLNIKGITKKSTKKVLCDKLYEREDNKDVSTPSVLATKLSPELLDKVIKATTKAPSMSGSAKKMSLLQLHDDLKQDKSKCVKVKSSKNPRGLTQVELYQLCIHLNIQNVNKKSTKEVLCDKLHQYEASKVGEKPASDNKLTPELLDKVLKLTTKPASPSSSSSRSSSSGSSRSSIPVKKPQPLKKASGLKQSPVLKKSEPVKEKIQKMQTMHTASKYTETYTLTFGDQAENHARMQKIGEAAKEGFTEDDLNRAEKYFNERGCETEMINLTEYLPEKDKSKAEPAFILIIRNGIEALTGSTADEFYIEQQKLSKDTKAFMYGHVVNKKARHNLCFGKESQEPCYEEAKGRIIAFDDVALLNKMRLTLPATIGVKALNLVAEGNYYYNPEICGIGWHGDSERKMVIALRLGKPMSLHYQWYNKSLPVGSRCDLMLNHGDIYYMSEKAVGCDWKKSSLYTLRHSAGAEKFTQINAKKTPLRK